MSRWIILHSSITVYLKCVYVPVPHRKLPNRSHTNLQGYICVQFKLSLWYKNIFSAGNWRGRYIHKYTLIDLLDLYSKLFNVTAGLCDGVMVWLCDGVIVCDSHHHSLHWMLTTVFGRRGSRGDRVESGMIPPTNLHVILFLEMPNYYIPTHLVE